MSIRLDPRILNCALLKQCPTFAWHRKNCGRGQAGIVIFVFALYYKLQTEHEVPTVVAVDDIS